MGAVVTTSACAVACSRAGSFAGLHPSYHAQSREKIEWVDHCVEDAGSQSVKLFHDTHQSEYQMAGLTQLVDLKMVVVYNCYSACVSS